MRADDFVTGDSARGAGQSSLVGTETTNAVNTGLVGSATAIAKNMVIGGTELGDVDKMYQTGKSAIKGSVGAARVGSDLVKDTVDTAKTTAKAFKAGLNGEDIDLYGCVLTASVCATWIRRNKKLWSIFLQELLSDMSCRRNYSFCNGTFPKPAFRL